MFSIAHAGRALPLNLTNTGSGGAVATVTKAADATQFWAVDAIHISGDTSTTAADITVTVTIGSTAVWTMFCGNEAGASFSREFIFPKCLLVGTLNESLTVASSDPGSGGVVRLNVQYR